MGDVGSGTGAGAGGASKSDVERLHELGYAQELKRGMSGFSNFAVSFTIISILSGCLTLFGFGMAIGGPDQLDLRLAARRPHGHVRRARDGRGLLELPDRRRPVLLVGEARASATRPAWSWFTGWFNMLGQVAITAGIDFGLAAIFSGVPERRVRRRHHQDHPDRDLHGRPGPARPAEHVRRAPGRALQRHERVVARVRRARRDARCSCSSPTSTRASRRCSAGPTARRL